MANPNLIEVANEIAYGVGNLKTFDERYDFIYDILDSASVRVKDQLETIIPQQTERR